MIVSGVEQCGSSRHDSRGIQNVSFCSSVNVPTCGMIDTIPTPLSKTSGVGRSAFLRSNGESRPLEYQPLGTTRTRRRWGRKEWGIVLGELRWGVGREGGGLWRSESGELVYGTEMGNRQPEKRDKVANSKFRGRGRVETMGT